MHAAALRLKKLDFIFTLMDYAVQVSGFHKLIIILKWNCQKPMANWMC